MERRLLQARPYLHISATQADEGAANTSRGRSKKQMEPHTTPKPTEIKKSIVTNFALETFAHISAILGEPCPAALTRAETSDKEQRIGNNHINCSGISGELQQHKRESSQ